MPDIPLNPSTLVTNGQLVSATNPLPVVRYSGSLPPAGTAVTLNPRTFIVNGELVSATNPLPIILTSDSDAQAWQAAAIANGATISPARMQVVSTFITAEKQAGTWDLTDDYFPLWGENIPQALTSLKQRQLAVPVSAPSFTIDRGYAFNGTINYVNTGFVPATHCVAATGTNIRAAVYERTDVSSVGTSMGCQNSGSINIILIARNASTIHGRLNASVGVNYTLTVATGLGYAVASRNGTDVASCFAYKNGVALVQQAAAPVLSSANPTQPLYIGAHNSAGTAASFRATSTGFACIGAALTPAQELAQYNNVLAWATSIGAQV